MKPVVVILAAGLGTRMKSGLAKAMHPVAGVPLVRHVLRAALETDPDRIVLVLGHQADRVRAAVSDFPVDVVVQKEQLGTGHAVMQAAEAIAETKGPVMVLCADTPLLTSAMLRRALETHQQAKAAVTLITAVVDNPFGYGRIVRSRGQVQRVVEEKDATAAQKKIKEVNAGIYCFDGKFLQSSLRKINRNNAQGEYYLPDLIQVARENKRAVAALVCDDPAEVMGVNSRHDLSNAEAVLRDRVNKHWMMKGVTLIDPRSAFIGGEVILGRDVTIYPNVTIEGSSKIGDNCVVYPGTRISSSKIADNVIVQDSCVIEASTIASGAKIGPFAHLRPAAEIGEGAHIGNFVEIKKSKIGSGSKANHLSYIGDAIVGSRVNIGAGTITCNYDGYAKYQTVIEDDVFVGSDSQLVAPVKIGKGALIAAGATITHDVPADALGISRTRQENKEGFAKRRRKQKQKK
jgi:bifunctional UDP-N-acetylglucosamine pyrophosphorylase/glucosamine-1-phosphate N-acetyltransferase